MIMSAYQIFVMTSEVLMQLLLNCLIAALKLLRWQVTFCLCHPDLIQRSLHIDSL